MRKIIKVGIIFTTVALVSVVIAVPAMAAPGGEKAPPLPLFNQIKLTQ